MPAPELLIPIEANLLADPDDLTTASWTNSAGCSDAASSEYFGTHRFTKVSRTDATANRYIHQSAAAKYNDGVVGQAIIRKGIVSGNYSAVLLYDDLSFFRGAVIITWATKAVTRSGGTAIWSRWLDNSTVWVAIMSSGANVNKLMIQPSEAGTPAAGDYVQVTMAMLEHALVPSYLPLELAARTALLTGAVWWKIEIDDDFDSIYTDFTGNLASNEVRVEGGPGGRFKEPSSAGASFKFRNSPKVWSEGDLRDCPVKISAKIGSSAYIQMFSGYVEPAGVSRDRASLTEDVVTVSCRDPLKSRGAARTAEHQTLYTGLKICDTATPANSIAHKLAALLGYDPADVEFIDINQTKDYVFIDKGAKYLGELQDLAIQHAALLGVRYDGKLRLVVWGEAEWNAAVPEYTFGSSNVHVPVHAPGADIVCNRAKTEFATYQVLDAGQQIYKSYESYDTVTRLNAINVAAGEYWPGATDANAVGKLGYERAGERFRIGVSIITPTIGATGSGSDIEFTGGALTLESFNGIAGTNPAKTDQQADGSEIILRNTAGAPCVITKFELRGTPIRILSRVWVKDQEAGLDEWEFTERTLPGKYATSIAQAEVSCQRLVSYGKVARKRYVDVPCDFTPHLQVGAIVLYNPAADINMTAVVERYTHQSRGPHTLTRTFVTLTEHVSFTSVAGGSDTGAEYNAGGGPESSDETAEDIADRPTYDEAITDGWDTGDGTTTPVTPTLSAFGLYKAANLQWTKQANLTNLARYELQVSPDAGVTAYALDCTGTGYTGAPGGDTDWNVEEFQHTRIPFSGTSDVPGATTYHYRVRAVTKATPPVESAWSGWVSATTLVIGTGDLGPEIINAAKIDAAEFLTLGNTGLIWYLPLDEETGTVARDCSTAENDATLNGTVALGVAGVAGGGADFAGADTDFIQADANLAGTHVSWAISAWLAPDTVVTGANQYAISNGRPILGLSTTGKPVIVWNDSGAVVRTLTDPDVLPSAGVYHHVVGTHDDSTDTTELWVDGVRKAVTTLYDSAAIAAGRWYVGRHSAAGAPFAGKIDEPRVYSRALTEKEIKYLYLNPSGAQYTQIDAKRILSDVILARHISVGVLNALVAEIASFLVISDTLGWVAGNPAVPAATDQRAYMDKNELRLQYHNGVGWQDRFAIAATDATDNYTATLTSCPLRLDVIKAASSAGLTIRETGGAYGLGIADDGSVSIAANNTGNAYTLALDRRNGMPTITGVNTTYGKSLVIDSYAATDQVYIQGLNTGDVILCSGAGTGGGTVGMGTGDLEAWSTSYLALEWAGSAIMGARGGVTANWFSNAYYDGAFRYKTTAAALAVGIDGSSRTFSISTAASAAIDTAITFQTELSVVGGATTTLNLGGAAGGSNRDVYLKLATDFFVEWLESTSAGRISVPTGGSFKVGDAGSHFLTATSSGIAVLSDTTADNINVSQAATGSYLKRNTSSLRYKTDVSDLPKAIADLAMVLRPIAFRSLCNGDNGEMIRVGFAAEEVDALGYPGLVTYIEKDGKRIPDGVGYQAIVPIAIAAIQDHEARIKVLEGR